VHSHVHFATVLTLLSLFVNKLKDTKQCYQYIQEQIITPNNFSLGIFITSFLYVFLCRLLFVYFSYVPVQSLQLTLWLLYQHLNNKDCNYYHNTALKYDIRHSCLHPCDAPIARRGFSSSPLSSSPKC
jgi:hypothetical protein